MINFIYQLLRTARPRQWLKNFSVFAAPVFLGTVFKPVVFWSTTHAFFAFCAMSSGTYFVNDIIDAPKDRTHPIKKNRPIASGKVSEKTAWSVAFLCIFGSIIYARTFVGTYFTIAIITYAVMQMFYSLYFRNVIIMDALVVGTGFVLRVFAGAFAATTAISSWLILTTISLSLLLAFGKRRSEKTLLLQHTTPMEKLKTRATLRYYPDQLLDSMISMSASACIITYALFTFHVSPQQTNASLISILPSILSSPKWMMLTIPIVIYGVARYLFVIYEKKEGESPERVLLSDKPLLTSVIVWIACIFGIIYLLPS
jgi:4-hydroxybenzoate polyprenyltransferase